MSIINDPNFINLKRLTIRYTLDGQEVTRTIKARQVARALYALTKAGESGITALEMGSWALRLGAYVFILRRQYRINVQTLREEHAGGWHARYVLRTPVEVLDVKIT